MARALFFKLKGKRTTTTAMIDGDTGTGGGLGGAGGAGEKGRWHGWADGIAHKTRSGTAS